MAVAGKKARLIVDLNDFSGDFNALTLSQVCGVEEHTCLGDGDQVFAPTVRGWTASNSGFFRAALYDKLATDLGEARLVAIYVGGYGFGKVAYCQTTPFSVSLEASSSATSLVTLSEDLQGSGPLERSRELFWDSFTADTTGQSLLWKSGSFAAGYLWVWGARDDSSLDVSIEDSADNSTFSSLLTFSTFTGTGFERVEFEGSVEKYTRAFLDVTDGANPGGSWEALVVVHVRG